MLEVQLFKSTYPHSVVDNFTLLLECVRMARMVMTSMCLHDDMAQSDVNLEAPLQGQARLG